MIKMDLTIYYSDPPLTQKEQEELDEKKKKGESYPEPRKMVDITNYVLSVTWNGNTDEAARKVDFSLAFNTTDKDSSFTAMLLNLGGFIYMYYADDTQEKVQIFSGRIFYQKRNTSNYSFEYVAYDDMIYLAQSKMNINFQNISITEAIKKVCAEVGIPVADDIPQMDTKVNWLADDKSGTEIFKTLSDQSWANHKPNSSGSGYGDYGDCPNTCAVIDAAREYGIDPKIAVAMAARESGGDDPRAIGSASQNMMQIEASTALYYGVEDKYPNWRTDPQQNAEAGMLVLSKKIEEQGGDTWAGVKAYNGSGPAADEYVSLVQNNYNNVGACEDAAPVQSETSTNTDNHFTVYCNIDKITAVKKGESVIENYTATDAVNIIHAEHSQSIENMKNRVKAVDEAGNVCEIYTIEDDATHYGTLQTIYKMKPPQKGEVIDNEKLAKAELKRMEETSSLEGIGNIQCITGYTITVASEQLSGKFFIKSDTHKFENNVHTMTLELEFVPEKEEVPEIKKEVIAKPIFKSSSSGSKKTYNTASGGGTLPVDQGMNAGWQAWGYQTMDNGTEGCCEAATKVGSYHSPFLADECNKGVVRVPNLVEDAKNAGVPVLDFDASQLEKGDCIVYYTSEGADGHVTIYDGEGGYIGNSSSRNMVWHSNDYTDCGTPMRIIKTSHY